MSRRRSFSYLLFSQDFDSFSDYMRQFPRDRYMSAVSDFHLLVFLATFDMLPLKVC